MTEYDEISMGSASTLTSESQKAELLQIYSSGVKREFRKSTLDSFNKAIRKIALPNIKFLPSTKALGGFEMPDLTSDDCWVHKIFDEVNMTRSTLKCKAEVWMTYRHKIKEQFGLHRAGVTMKMKKMFVKGKKILEICIMKSIIIFNKRTFSIFQLQTEMKLYYEADSDNEDSEDQEFPIKEIHDLLKDDNIHLIQEKGSLEANILYSEMCYPGMVGKQKWKFQHMDCLLRSLVTEADEALAAVILENNFEDWDRIARGLELDKNNRRTKYTHRGEDPEGQKKGWSLKGRQRYNDMFDTIERLRRDLNHGETLESDMKEKWKERGMRNKRKRTDDVDAEEEERRKEREERFRPRFSAF